MRLPKLTKLSDWNHQPITRWSRNTMKGIRRTKGTAPEQKAPTLTDDIRAMVDATDTGIIGTRDRALILLGFAGAFRRSELVGLDVEDCTFGKDGLTVTLRRSKTDQDGAGRKIGIPYGSNPETCPVRTVQAWMEIAGIAAGPLFRSINRHGRVRPGRLSGIDVARVVKKLARACRTRSSEVRWPLATGRTCNSCGDCWGVGTLDYGADRPSIRADGPAVYSGWEFVPGEQRGQAGLVASIEAVTTKFKSHFAKEISSTHPRRRNPSAAGLMVRVRLLFHQSSKYSRREHQYSVRWR